MRALFCKHVKSLINTSHPVLQDLDELMYPGKAPQPLGGHRAGGSIPPVKLRRQTADNIQSRAAANGTVAFVLEEPIVPTQEMVPTGPRR